MPTPEQNMTDADEIAKFDAMAEEWWDSEGKFRPLHQLNPCRLDYINAQICAEFGRDLGTKLPYKGLQIVDIGCGGGLLCEPMARLGADVTGIDGARRNIPVAEAHAAQSGLEINYRAMTAEEMGAEGKKFDVVLNMEVIEHVANPAAYVACCATFLKPGGIMILSTLNRTLKSFALAIIGAEYVLRLLPRGTHEWKKFITPAEIKALLEESGLEQIDLCGMVFNPLYSEWKLSPDDTGVNYVTTSRNPKG